MTEERDMEPVHIIHIDENNVSPYIQQGFEAARHGEQCPCPLWFTPESWEWMFGYAIGSVGRWR